MSSSFAAQPVQRATVIAITGPAGGFARTEGILPAPEPTHAIAACIEEALRCKETGEEKVILTALCGHGLLDLAAYANFQSGEMTDFALPDQAVRDALSRLPAGVS